MKEEDPSAKAIVFSQFTSMLELIQFRLTQTGRVVVVFFFVFFLIKKKEREGINEFIEFICTLMTQ